MGLPFELPSLAALTAFEAALRHRSFTRAAVELHRTQGAVSRQVAAMEAALGVQLFHREHPQVRPTRAAEVYGARVRRHLDGLAAATLDLVSTGAEGGSLTLAILPTFGTSWLIPRLPQFHSAHPAIALHLTTSLRAFDFETEQVDAAIHYGEGVWPSARVEPLMQEEVVLVCAPALREVDLAEQTLLHLASRPDAWSDWLATRTLEGLEPRRGPRFEHHQMVLQAARAGLGAALLPSFVAEPALREGALVEPIPDGRMASRNGYWLAYPERSLELPALHALRRWLHEELRAAGLRE